MNVVLESETPPLRQDSTGALRLGESNVLLEMVLHAFQDGATPEAIIQRYPTTTLSDVYAAISYYLRHQEEVGAYLRQRDILARDVRNRIERQQGDLKGLRQRLLANKT